MVEATLARKLTEHVERIDTDLARTPPLLALCARLWHPRAATPWIDGLDAPVIYVCMGQAGRLAQTRLLSA